MGGKGTLEQRRKWQKDFRESEKGKASRKAYTYTDKCKQYHKEYYKRNWLKIALRGMKYRALNKGLEFSLSPEDIVVPEFCPILGIPLEKQRGAMTANSPSVDRIDNSKGYTKDNISVISSKANKCKQDLTIEQVEKLLKYMKKETIK